jgi:hypothetical protein
MQDVPFQVGVSRSILLAKEIKEVLELTSPEQLQCVVVRHAARP